MCTEKNIIEQRYKELNSWFERYKKRSCFYYYACQITVILCSALTPIAMMIFKSDGNWGVAILPVIVVIVASIQTLFRFNETWVSRAEASERLKSEHTYYKSGLGTLYSSSLPEKEVLKNFLDKIEQINREERLSWASIQEKNRQLNNKTNKAIKSDA